MRYFLEVADAGQHRQNSLYHHPVVPLSTFADTQVVSKPVHFGKPLVSKHNHLVTDAFNYMLELAAIIDIGSVTLPIDN